MWPNPQKIASLVTFTQEFFNRTFIFVQCVWIFTIYIYIHICHHENNVPSRSSPQWLCGNSCTWAHEHNNSINTCVSWITYGHLYICIYIYTHTHYIQTDRLPHLWSGDSQGQERFLAPSADKQTRNYDMYIYIYICMYMYIYICMYVYIYYINFQFK